MGYWEKLAKKNKMQCVIVKKIYIGDTSTCLESTGYGKWQIRTPNSVFKIKDDGIYISGNVKIDSPMEITGDVECKKKITAKLMEDKSKA